MMKHTSILVAAALVALSLNPSRANAHCGTCGSGDAHKADAHKTDAKATAASATTPATQAIFPLAEAAGFKTLTAAVKAAGLQATLTEKGPFTVFAPTDEAFAKLPKGTVEGLLANPEKLKKVLLHHVVAGDVRAAAVVKLKTAKSLNGTSLAIDATDGVKVGGAKVIKADVGASNGVIHVIDTVLIPNDL
jgi:uncharacterized surface protein with fasciclin (FAS1) repeats